MINNECLPTKTDFTYQKEKRLLIQKWLFDKNRD